MNKNVRLGDKKCSLEEINMLVYILWKILDGSTGNGCVRVQESLEDYFKASLCLRLINHMALLRLLSQVLTM